MRWETCLKASKIIREAIAKILHYGIICALLSVILAASAHGSIDTKEIITPAERLWLTENQSRIVLAVETGYAPFLFLDSKDQPNGLAHDYMLLLESKLGFRFRQRRFASLDDIFSKVRSGEVHVVNAVTKTPWRSEFLSFTESFITVPNVIVVRKERLGQMREGDLTGLKVSLVTSYAVTEQLIKKGLGFVPDLVPDDLTGLFNVSFGRSDAAVIDLATASYLIAQKGITNLRVAGEVALDIQLSMGVPHAEPILLSIIQKGLRAITETERREIHTRWINASSQSIFSDRRVWLVIASVVIIIFAVIGTIVVWNRMLRRQVALRTEDLAKEKESLLKIEAKLQEQNEELQVNEEELRSQNDELLATEEMLRVQINEFETSQKLLKESKARFDQVAELSNTVIWEMDARGLVTYISPVCEAVFGFRPDEAIGQIHFYDRFPELERDALKEAVFGLFERKEPFKNLENNVLTKDGRLVWVSTNGIPVLNVEGNLLGYRGSDTDITVLKCAEAARLNLEKQLLHAQKLESLGVLAGGIAHDFNNILTVIMGHCYMAQNDMIPEKEYKAAFQKMETAGNRAKDLCRQMLTYAGKSPMEQTRLNLWLLVDEVVKMLQAAIKKNITIELDLKRDVPEINGDTGQIQQIIMNLIINAADAIGEANGTIRVVLTKTVFEEDQTADTFGTVIKAGIFACMEVTDTGCGMDEGTQKRIFEPFFTTKFTGRGLGMSAIYGIIKSHEAILQLTSKPGVGTTFKIFFPVLQPSDYAKTPLISTVRPEDASGTILFVEDEDLLRIMGKELLEAHGFSAMTASNGSEAIEIYRERSSEIDVILMDLVMPVMGGIETYHELRKISPTLPVIICSGYGVESVEHVIKNDPHAGFVHKPYKPDELRDVLMRMMKEEGSKEEL